jgi:dolichyl-phosphate beta-glucosyltransferase
MSEIHLSIIIPAYNEEERIGPTLEGIFEFLAGRDYAGEVILVDDGSSDKTVEAAKASARAHENFRVLENGANRGKGYSVRHGMLEGKGEYLLFSDADLSTPIEETTRFLEKMREGYHVVIGSRAMPESNIATYQPWYRQLMGKIFNKIVRVMAVRGIRDTQCGFKMFTREAGRRIFALQQVERFAFDVETLFLARKLGYKICELPVTWKDSPQTRISTFMDSWSMFSALFTIRLNSLRGRYKS